MTRPRRRTVPSEAVRVAGVTSLPELEPPQRDVVDAWFPGAVLVADHSWGIAGRTVLHLRCEGRDVVLKAGAPGDHHMDREIWAYSTVVEALSARALAPSIVHADRGLRLLATTYLPGVLVERTSAEHDPATYRQAGRALALFHGQGTRPGADYEERMDAKALDWLERDHRIKEGVMDRLRSELATPVPPRRLAPTHGDWQPRNWIVDNGHLAVIDFGRADWRPAATDLARLAAQQSPRAPRPRASIPRRLRQRPTPVPVVAARPCTGGDRDGRLGARDRGRGVREARTPNDRRRARCG